MDMADFQYRRGAGSDVDHLEFSHKAGPKVSGVILRDNPSDDGVLESPSGFSGKGSRCRNDISGGCINPGNLEVYGDKTGRCADDFCLSLHRRRRE